MPLAGATFGLFTVTSVSPVTAAGAIVVSPSELIVFRCHADS